MPRVLSVQPTPNENAMKFTLDGPSTAGGAKTYSSAAAAAENPVAAAIWRLGGIRSVFMVADFVTVTKTAEADWDTLAAQVQSAIDGA
jgi:hypothetical protein